MNAFSQSLVWTASRHPIKLLRAVFVAFSVLWTATEAVSHFFDWMHLKDSKLLFAMVIVSAGYAFVTRWRSSSVTIPLKQTNVSIEIMFGDIFQCDGVTVITATEFFDSEIGTLVSPSSLLGVFIEKCFGGHPQAFDKQIEDQLANTKSTRAGKKNGKTASYPIGTTALVTASRREYFVLAFSHADTETFKARADVRLMFEALSGLWKFGRTHLNGRVLNLPLVGSGLSGVGLPAMDLLNIIMLSFADECRRQVIGSKLRIVLNWDRIDQVDLRKLKSDWEEK